MLTNFLNAEVSSVGCKIFQHIRELVVFVKTYMFKKCIGLCWRVQYDTRLKD